MCSSLIDHYHELEVGAPVQELPVFSFQKRYGEINWRRLSSIDLDKILRDLDFSILQENISHITFCNVDSVSDLDPLVGKLLKLTQYTIEYLLHSQEYLQSVIEALERKCSEVQKQEAEKTCKIKQCQAEITKLKDDAKKRKKMIQQQQLLIESGASSFFQCPQCEKAFLNAAFLQGHLTRRHPDAVKYIGDAFTHAEKEQKRLQEHIDSLKKSMLDDKECFENKLKETAESKKKWERQTLSDMDDWKKSEQEKWQNRFDMLTQTYDLELRESKGKGELYERKIADLEKAKNRVTTHLGELVDDFNGEKQNADLFRSKVSGLEKRSNDKAEEILNMSQQLYKMQLSAEDKYNKHEQKLGNEISELKMKIEKLGNPTQQGKSSFNAVASDLETLYKQVKVQKRQSPTSSVDELNADELSSSKMNVQLEKIATKNNVRTSAFLEADAALHVEDLMKSSQFRNKEKRDDLKETFKPIVYSLLEDQVKKFSKSAKENLTRQSATPTKSKVERKISKNSINTIKCKINEEMNTRMLKISSISEKCESESKESEPESLCESVLKSILKKPPFTTSTLGDCVQPKVVQRNKKVEYGGSCCQPKTPETGRSSAEERESIYQQLEAFVESKLKADTCQETMVSNILSDWDDSSNSEI